MRNPFRAGNYKSDSKSLGRSDTQNGVYYFHSALLGLSRFSSAVAHAKYAQELIQNEIVKEPLRTRFSG